MSKNDNATQHHTITFIPPKEPPENLTSNDPPPNPSFVPAPPKLQRKRSQFEVPCISENDEDVIVVSQSDNDEDTLSDNSRERSPDRAYSPCVNSPEIPVVKQSKEALSASSLSRVPLHTSPEQLKPLLDPGPNDDSDDDFIPHPKRTK